MSMTRIAMWSGPRNISTAMMRSWENRPDTFVVDEPLYGPYLASTGKKHPCYKEVIADQGKDWKAIVKGLTEGEINTPHIFYQKHMTHHILPDMDISWVEKLSNAFLIRSPEEVLASYLRKHDNPKPEDLGFPQQLRLFNFLREKTGKIPLVIESKDILKSPKEMMKRICKELNVSFQESMLKWPKGYRNSDGVWAHHWYNRVIESNGFSKYKTKELKLSKKEQSIADQCQEYYLGLKKHKLTLK